MRNQLLSESSPGVLSPEQGQLLEALIQTLTPEQHLWVSGYLAGLAAQGAQAAPPAPASASVEQMAVTILYGSETGNSAGLARRLGAEMEGRGLRASVENMADYSVRRLKKVNWLIVVTATHGEGEPPEPAATFFEDLHSPKAPQLEGVKFAVLALGDSTYEFYCEAGKAFDRRLEELGGERFQERIDCDVDYEEEAEAWMERVVAQLEKEAPEAQPSSPAADRSSGVIETFPGHFRDPGAAPRVAPRYDKTRPFPAPVIDSVDITGRGSSKRIRHLELSLDDSGLEYLPGDSLGIAPQNAPEVVEELLEAAGLDGQERIAVKNDEIPLAEALTHHFEITVMTPRFLESWARLSEASALQALLEEKNKTERLAFLEQNHVLELLEAYPVPGISATDLVSGLRRLQPRLYSLASSPSAMPDEAHLTVSLLSYEMNGRPREGVASSFLCNRLGVGETLPVYVQDNPNFRLPEDSETPIIMVGAGTGVAPYRSFLYERRELGQGGRNWLIFGERNFRTDFLYQIEWQRFLKDSLLTRMSVAFSRDQDYKIYVQDRLREEGRAVFSWLEEGAHFYVCGDATEMAPAVQETLQTVIAEEGGMSSERAADYLRRLRSEKRYQRDVY